MVFQLNIISYNTLLTFWVQRFIWVHLEQLTRTSQIPHLHVMHRNHCKIHQEHYVVNGAAPVALTHSETCVVLSSSLIFHLCQWNCKHFHISIAPWISVTFPLIHNLEWKKRRIEAVAHDVCANWTWCKECMFHLVWSLQYESLLLLSDIFYHPHGLNPLLVATVPCSACLLSFYRSKCPCCIHMQLNLEALFWKSEVVAKQKSCTIMDVMVIQLSLEDPNLYFQNLPFTCISKQWSFYDKATCGYNGLCIVYIYHVEFFCWLWSMWHDVPDRPRAPCQCHESATLSPIHWQALRNTP